MKLRLILLSSYAASVEVVGADEFFTITHSELVGMLEDGVASIHQLDIANDSNLSNVERLKAVDELCWLIGLKRKRHLPYELKEMVTELTERLLQHLGIEG